MLKIKEIANRLNGEIIGNKNLIIEGICDIEVGKKNHLSYMQNNSYVKYLKKTNASVIVIDKTVNIDNINKTFILVENASFSFILLMEMFKYNLDIINPLHKKEINKNNIQVGKNIIFEDNIKIGKNVIIGNNVKIFSGCFIGDNSIIGDATIIYPNVVIYDNVIIGNNCKIDAGTIIGADGFGTIKNNKINYSVPHIGGVVIGDDVYIGANCCIDRGTIKNTIINNNCRLDNQIQIAHNVILGESCVIAGQVAIAGSTELGKHVTVAGQSGIIDHLKIGDYTIVGAKSMVANSTSKGSFVSGNPAVDHKNRLKQEAAIKKLPKIIKKIK